MTQQDHKHSLSPGQPWICVQLTQGRQRRKSSSAYVLTQRSFVFPLSALHPPLKTKHSSPGKYCDGQPGVVVFSFFAITCWWGVGGWWWWYFERSVVVMLIFKGQPIVAIPEMKKWCKGKEEPQGNFFFFYLREIEGISRRKKQGRVMWVVCIPFPWCPHLSCLLVRAVGETFQRYLSCGLRGSFPLTLAFFSAFTWPGKISQKEIQARSGGWKRSSPSPCSLWDLDLVEFHL